MPEMAMSMMPPLDTDDAPLTAQRQVTDKKTLSNMNTSAIKRPIHQGSQHEKYD